MLVNRKIPKATLLVAVIAMTTLLSGCGLRKVFAQNHKPPVVYRDLNYIPDGKNAFQTLDLYVPSEGKAPFPLIVWIHGGAWVAGDKNHPPAEPLTNNGFAVASLNYRLSTQASYPAQIHDCKAAVRWLRAHAKEYKLDPDRVGAWGHSAGGHLSALLATSGDVKTLEGDLGNNQYSSRVQAACDWAGPTNFNSIAAHTKPGDAFDFNKPGNPVDVLMGGHPTPEAAASGSPIAFVSADDPPILIVHGATDNVVPAEQSREFDKACRAAGVKSECIIIDREGHGIGFSMIQPTIDFFKKNLLK